MNSNTRLTPTLKLKSLPHRNVRRQGGNRSRHFTSQPHLMINTFPSYLLIDSRDATCLFFKVMIERQCLKQLSIIYVVVLTVVRPCFSFSPPAFLSLRVFLTHKCPTPQSRNTIMNQLIFTRRFHGGSCMMLIEDE